MDQWVEVGSVADIPLRGSRVVSTSRGDIAIFKTAEGRVFALSLLAETVRPRGVTGGTKARDDLFPRDVEFLAGHNDGIGRRRFGRRAWSG